MNRYIKKLILGFYSRFDSPDRRRKHSFIKRNYGIEIGKYTYGYSLSKIAKETKIGSFCSIASGVSIGLMKSSDRECQHPPISIL